MEIPSTLTLVTGNPNKLAEIRRLVRSPSGRDAGAGALPELDSVALDLPEIQSLDLEEVLRAKGEEARRRVDGPVVVEETGLEVEAFGGFPGPLVKWMLQTMGAGGIARAARALSAAGDSGDGAPRAAATARCLLLYVDGERRVLGEGVEPGELVFPPRGDQGFGWDPVFLPEGETRTYGELPGEVKDEIGHRGKAWRDLMRRLGGG
ncbi:MAG: non-canonical purine NTP pyrophosphatase [Acidobacteriota bacterium]|jgi:non-canonical purine NTP pyrophosphatase (RdgB/HAM1 family)